MRLREVTVSVTLAALVAGCGNNDPTGTRDTTPPARITNLAAGNGPDGSFLTWTAPGDDASSGTVSRYDIRYVNGDIVTHWGDAIPLTSPASVVAAGQTQIAAIDSLGPGVWQFGVKAADEVPNWSDLSNVASVTISRDTIPPARITNLAIGNGTNGYFLTWTAPGDDGSIGTISHYDIRYINGDIITHWGEAIALTSPTILAAGQTQIAAIDSLGPGIWQFGVKAADEAPNWSDLSNVASMTIAPDTIPPASVTDLAAEAILGGVRLHWTASGDDGLSGTAAVYDLRFSTQVITAETWAAATPVEGVGAPKTSGEPQSATVFNLQAGQEYSFALRSADESGNWSDISNITTVYLPQPSLRQLTFNTSYVGAVSENWSPDGSFIGCTMGIGMSYFQVFAMPLSGGNPEQYTFLFPTNASMPAWSPDGTHIAFVRISSDPSSWRLAVMEATPGAPGMILASHTGLLVGTPHWSPDGTRIAYRAFRFTGGGGEYIGDLYSISSGGGIPTHLAGPFTTYGLSWSPDGTMIAFDSGESGNSDIWIMPAAGGPATRLTTGSAAETMPAWSPDGAVIAYIAEGKIWGIAPTGGPSFVLVNDTGINQWRGLTWSPDERSLAYTKYNVNFNIWVASIDAQN